MSFFTCNPSPLPADHAVAFKHRAGWLRGLSASVYLGLVGLLIPLPVLPAAGKTVEIQILATTDLHGSFMDAGSVRPDEGGWLRLATRIRQRRETFGSARTILIDCGDSTQGSFVDGLSHGQASLEMLKTLDYDIWVPGNHDLDYGIPRAAEMFAAMSGNVLCGNLELTVDKVTRHYPAWKILERDGARIAVIGATANYLQQWLWGDTATGLKVEKAGNLLRRILPEVHAAKPDLILLAIHQGWVLTDSREVNEVTYLVQRFPELNLILGGHTHREVAGEKIGPASWYVQAGNYGSSLGVVRVKLDTGTHTVLEITSELDSAPAQVARDPVAEKAYRPWQEKAEAAGRKVAGRLQQPIDTAGIAGENCTVSELICQALAEAVDAEVVFHGKLSGAGLRAGPITEEALFLLLPFENNIGVAWLTPGEIREIIQEQLLLRDNPNYYNGLWGLKAEVDPAGKVSRLNGPDGHALPAGQRLKTAFNSYVIAGGGGRFPRLREILRQPEARLQDTGIGTREALSRYLGKHPALTVKPAQWLHRNQP